MRPLPFVTAALAACSTIPTHVLAVPIPSPVDIVITGGPILSNIRVPPVIRSIRSPSYQVTDGSKKHDQSLNRRVDSGYYSPNPLDDYDLSGTDRKQEKGKVRVPAEAPPIPGNSGVHQGSRPAAPETLLLPKPATPHVQLLPPEPARPTSPLRTKKMGLGGKVALGVAVGTAAILLAGGSFIAGAAYADYGNEKRRQKLAEAPKTEATLD